MLKWKESRPVLLLKNESRLCLQFFNAEAATRGVLQKRFSEKFRNIHRETPVLESALNKVTILKAYNFIRKRL